jgi:hypothetical protein
MSDIIRDVQEQADPRSTISQPPPVVVSTPESTISELPPEEAQPIGAEPSAYGAAIGSAPSRYGASEFVPQLGDINPGQAATAAPYQGIVADIDTEALLQEQRDLTNWRHAAYLANDIPTLVDSNNTLGSQLTPVPGFTYQQPVVSSSSRITNQYGAALPPGLAQAGGLQPQQNVMNPFGGFNAPLASDGSTDNNWDLGQMLMGIAGLGQMADDGITDWWNRMVTQTGASCIR